MRLPDLRTPGDRSPERNSLGVLKVGSPQLRQVCAIGEDGTMHLVKEYNTAEVAAELLDLRERFDLPEITSRRPATLAEIATLHAGHRSEGDTPGPGARRLIRVLGEAAALKASDIKIVLRDAHADLRVKLGHVEVRHGPEWAPGEAGDAISFLFDNRDVGDGSSSEEQGAFQAFSVSPGGGVPLPGGVAALRCQKGPQGLHGRNFLAARLVYAGAAGDTGDLDSLGFDGEALEVLAEERASESGMMVIGGSTGDGKSTTLVRQLERLYIERGRGISLYTVEDPIEAPMRGSGIMQMAVPGGGTPTERAEAFTRTLMAFVRTNPDIGMVSEIRTAADARLILQFVTSGHKVFTTVHSASANNVLFRLVSLGVDPRELAEPGVVSLVMRQRLVPVLCPACAVTPGPAVRDAVAVWTGVPGAKPRRRHPQGCPECLRDREGATARAAWAGIVRRRAVAEWIRVDNRYRALLADRDSLGAWNHWLAPVADGGLGGRTVNSRIRGLVASGEVDCGYLPDAPAEVRR